jgi:hypothetical protein
MPSMYYLRTRDGLEIDLVLEVNQKMHLFEIKSGATIVPKHASSLLKAGKDPKLSADSLSVISRSSESSFSLGQGAMNYNWANLLFR